MEHGTEDMMNSRNSKQPVSLVPGIRSRLPVNKCEKQGMTILFACA